jgi:hypothetical protein
MPKLHLKRAVTERIALCKIWPGDNWIIVEQVSHTAEPVCKICSVIAAKLHLEKTPKTRSTGA